MVLYFSHWFPDVESDVNLSAVVGLLETKLVVTCRLIHLCSPTFQTYIVISPHVALVLRNLNEKATHNNSDDILNTMVDSLPTEKIIFLRRNLCTHSKNVEGID